MEMSTVILFVVLVIIVHFFCIVSVNICFLLFAQRT